MNLASNAKLCGAPAVLEEKFAEYLQRFGEPGGAAKLVFEKAAGFPHRDAYRVESAPDAVTVTAGTDEGLFYGAWEVLARGKSSRRWRPASLPGPSGARRSAISAV